jgi:cyclopropane fatty-acyl-phospholipid synthase-like methyltransferase
LKIFNEPSVPAQYFVDLYKQNADPWDFETSEYERSKYQATLKALPLARYANALELGCSIGVFTEMLAQRCDRLLAIDVSEDALNRARERCSAERNVTFSLLDLNSEFPDGAFDLTTVCEIGYYFSRADLARICEKIVDHSLPGAHVVLVHFTPENSLHPLRASDVHECFMAHPRLHHLDGFAHSTYRLDVFEHRT